MSKQFFWLIRQEIFDWCNTKFSSNNFFVTSMKNLFKQAKNLFAQISKQEFCLIQQMSFSMHSSFNLECSTVP